MEEIKSPTAAMEGRVRTVYCSGYCVCQTNTQGVQDTCTCSYIHVFFIRHQAIYLNTSQGLKSCPVSLSTEILLSGNYTMQECRKRQRRNAELSDKMYVTKEEKC